MRHRKAASLATALLLIGLGLAIGVVSSSASPSSWFELNSSTAAKSYDIKTNDGHVDWADSSTAGTGLFSGGTVSTSGHTWPNAPSLSYTGTDAADILASAFIVDPLSNDSNGCGTGDPTVYTGAGGETNGEGFASETWGTGSVPQKDEVANVYAVAHKTSHPEGEVFFGAERVVNNGDSHIDFEFLQDHVTLSGTCSGGFNGHRTQGDLLLAVDFTSGGTFGGKSLYEWHCNAEGTTQPADGTQCDPAAHGKSVPHYQPTTSTTLANAVNFGVNANGAVDCGGWICRTSNGSTTSTVPTNAFMEGGIDLHALNFTGCISTFLPHTRSSQSFTATLKDFAPPTSFNTCVPRTTLTASSGTTTPTIHSGDSVTFTFTESNTSVGEVSLGNPHVSTENTNCLAPAGVMGTGAITNPPSTTQADTAHNVGDLNNNGSLDKSDDPWRFSCTFNVTSADVPLVGYGHGTFGSKDVTYCSDPNSPPTNTICSQTETASATVNFIAPATTLTATAKAVITYTFNETNPGNSDLTDPKVRVSGCAGTGSDTTLADMVMGTGAVTTPASTTVADTAHNAGDVDNDGVLDKASAETWVFQCTYTLNGPTGDTGNATDTGVGVGHGTDSATSPKDVTFCADITSPGTGIFCSQTERDRVKVTIENLAQGADPAP